VAPEIFGRNVPRHDCEQQNSCRHGAPATDGSTVKIPEDIYERVFDLATGLMNASEADDTRTYWQLYGELRTYCEAQTARDHPFLWETLADFTTDDQASIVLYTKALSIAKRLDASEYEASILFALAERYSDIGNKALAYRYALEANETAKALDDLDLRRSISEFLLRESSRTSSDQRT
jgi:hypothetical protein